MHPDTTIKQISIQALNRVIFDPLPKPSQFWSLHCNQVISDPPHWNHHGSIPEDFGNRGESTLTNLQTSKKQWQKHRKKGQTTANGTSKVFFLRIRNRGMAMGILPQEFAFEGKRKIPVAIPRFLLLKNKKKNTVIRFAVAWPFLRCFCFVMVDLPLFPKLSRIDPKKAPEITSITTAHTITKSISMPTLKPFSGCALSCVLYIPVRTCSSHSVAMRIM